MRTLTLAGGASPPQTHPKCRPSASRTAFGRSQDVGGLRPPTPPRLRGPSALEAMGPWPTWPFQVIGSALVEARDADCTRVISP